MGEFAPVKQFVKKPKYPTVADLYPPNNSREFLQSLADAEEYSRMRKYTDKARRTNTRKPTLPSTSSSLIQKY